jgi:integrase
MTVWQRNRRAIYLMLYGGLRIAEASALLWRDVDLDTRVLWVRDGKGGKDRSIPIHPVLLKELLAAPDRDQVPAVLANLQGLPINPKSLAHLFERQLRKLGVHITAHQLRHSFATEMLRAGADLRSIQELMGHEKLETTQRYLMVDAERMRAAVNLLPEAW